jgi:opacity protein-like surface antigen
MRHVILKIMLASILVTEAMQAYAIGNGFYLGMMAGPATNNVPSMQATKLYDFPNPTPWPMAPIPPGTTIANPRANQFGIRIFMGNQFNQFAAFEVGGMFWSSIRYNTRGIPIYGSADQRVRDIDVMIKGILPFRSFNLYGKIGAAATYLTSGGTFNMTFTPLQLAPNSTAVIKYAKLSVPTTYKFKFSPVYSVGASYDIDQSWVIDASLNGISVGNSIGNLMFYAIGISYHFTDKYCGQFLCDD